MPVPSLGAELLGGPGERANGLPKGTTQADRVGERPPHEPNQQRAGSSRRPFLALLSRLRRGAQPPSARPAAEEGRWGGNGSATVGRVDDVLRHASEPVFHDPPVTGGSDGW